MTEEPLENPGVGEGCPLDRGLNVRLTTDLIVELGATVSKQEWERKKRRDKAPRKLSVLYSGPLSAPRAWTRGAVALGTWGFRWVEVPTLRTR